MFDNQQVVVARGWVELKARGTDITSEFVRQALEEFIQLQNYKISTNEFESLAQIIETQLDINQNLGHTISAQGFTKWWDERKINYDQNNYFNLQNNASIVNNGKDDILKINIVDKKWINEKTITKAITYIGKNANNEGLTSFNICSSPVSLNFSRRDSLLATASEFLLVSDIVSVFSAVSGDSSSSDIITSPD